MPNGESAPGKSFALFAVPMKLLTEAAGSLTSVAAWVTAAALGATDPARAVAPMTARQVNDLRKRKWAGGTVGWRIMNPSALTTLSWSGGCSTLRKIRCVKRAPRCCIQTINPAGAQGDELSRTSELGARKTEPPGAEFSGLRGAATALSATPSSATPLAEC